MVAFKPLDEQIEKTDTCWLWKGSTSVDGYGRVNPKTWGTWAAHRLLYELYYGPIPKGLTINHKCRVRNCVNPEHLELMTVSENTSDNAWSRKTHCPKGHPYDEVNTRYYRGRRYCRTCLKEWRNTR